jgi:hypothetical protein
VTVSDLGAVPHADSVSAGDDSGWNGHKRPRRPSGVERPVSTSPSPWLSSCASSPLSTDATSSARRGRSLSSASRRRDGTSGCRARSRRSTRPLHRPAFGINPGRVDHSLDPAPTQHSRATAHGGARSAPAGSLRKRAQSARRSSETNSPGGSGSGGRGDPGVARFRNLSPPRCGNRGRLVEEPQAPGQAARVPATLRRLARF